MSRMQSEDPREQVAVRVDESLKEEYRETVEAEGKSMSKDLREHMEAVAGREYTGSREYYPADSGLRSLYEDLLDVMNEDLRVNMHVHGPTLAQKRQTKVKQLHHQLKPLMKKGYVAREVGGIASKRVNIAYRIKPPHADPEKWVYRQEFE